MVFLEHTDPLILANCAIRRSQCALAFLCSRIFYLWTAQKVRWKCRIAHWLSFSTHPPLPQPLLHFPKFPSNQNQIPGHKTNRSGCQKYLGVGGGWISKQDIVGVRPWFSAPQPRASTEDAFVLSSIWSLGYDSSSYLFLVWTMQPARDFLFPGFNMVFIWVIDSRFQTLHNRDFKHTAKMITSPQPGMSPMTKERKKKEKL